MKSLTITLLFSALSLLATAQTFDEKTFGDVIQSYQKDLVGYLKTNTAPDYTFTSNGQVLDAKAFIKRFEAYKVTTFETSNVKVRQYGTAAFVTGTAHHVYTSKTDGSTRDYTALFSYTFAYQGGKWLILGGQHSDIPIDIKQEEAAIKTVLEAETKAAYAGDLMLSNWHLAPKTRFVATTTTGQSFYGGSGEEVHKLFADNIKPSTNTAASSNYNIQIASGGKMAWATYDQTTRDKEGKTLSLSHEIRCLENVNGTWKVVVVSAHFYKQ
jgi:hypothetical protein